MKLNTPQMEEYFDSLPAKTQESIIYSRVKFSTLNQLKQLSEYFKE